MKILKCTTCGLVMQTVQAAIEVRQRVRLDKTGSFYVDSDFNHVYGEKVFPIDKSFSCPECDTCTVEAMEVEMCPHIWEISWWEKAEQTCKLCGQTRQGRLVFE